MTPEQLDAIEATISESTAWDGWGLDRAQVSDLIAALREAWAERDDLFTRASIASGDARYLRAALDRVRALCDEYDIDPKPAFGSVPIWRLRAAIDGSE